MRIIREIAPEHGCMECGKDMHIAYVIVFEHPNDPTEVAVCYRCIRRLLTLLNKKISPIAK